MRPVFAICDLETEYAIRFMEYLNLRKLPFEVQMFTETAPLLAYGKQKHIELLLISERAMCEEIRALQVGQLVLLSEEKEAGVLDFPTIYKYQAASGVVREVLDCYSAQRSVIEEVPALRHHGKTIAVYGLLSPLQQMLFSLTYGQVRAEHASVLYVPLQKYAGLEFFTEEKTAGDLGDVLYLFRTGTGDFSYRLSGLLQKLGSLEYIPSPFCAEDIGELDGNEWTDLITRLHAACGHDILLLDLGDAVRGLPQVLQACDQCLFLYEKNDFHEQQQRMLLQAWGLEERAGFRWLCPPKMASARPGRWFAETLPQSAEGAYIRRFLQKEATKEQRERSDAE